MPEIHEPEMQLPDVLLALDAELNRAITADQQRVRANGQPAPAGASRGPLSWLRSHRGMTVALGLATAGLLWALSALVFADRPFDSPLSTQEALAEVAAAAKSNPLPFAAEDQFLYTHSEGTYMNSFMGGRKTRGGPELAGFTALVTRERKAWVSVERFGAFEEQQGAVKWVTGRDRLNAEKYGRDLPFDRPDNVMGLAPNGSYFVGSESLTRAQVLAYPTAPTVIHKRILDGLNGAGQGAADGVWQSLTESLYESSYPADLRAGMVEALGLIPGVKSLGVQRDPLGREGYAFAREHAGVSEQIIFDATTSSVLYTHGELTEPSKQLPGWPVGTTVESYLLIEQDVVDEMPERVAKRLDR